MAADRAVYLDSSALVKLVVREAESEALTAYLRTRPLRVASALVRVEVPRAVRRHGPEALERAAKLISPVRLLALDDGLLDAAALLDADGLRSLDAIHLASAMTLGDDLDALVTYDERMTGAAHRLGLTCDAPS
jgi:predicted nucleic acid-binding protein